MKVKVAKEFRDIRNFSHTHPVGEVIEVDEARGGNLLALGLATEMAGPVEKEAVKEKEVVVTDKGEKKPVKPAKARKAKAVKLDAAKVLSVDTVDEKDIPAGADVQEGVELVGDPAEVERVVRMVEAAAGESER